jgi:hypothetical protein
MSMILTLNAGSSSVKFGLYCATDKPEPEVKAKGQIDGLGLDAQLIVQIGQGPPQKIALGSTDQATGISAILQALAPILAGRPVSGVGHRIVHGGPNIRRWHPCISPITWLPSRRRRLHFRMRCRWVALTPHFTAIILGSTIHSRYHAATMRKACVAMAFTACLMTTSPAHWRRTIPIWQRVG